MEYSRLDTTIPKMVSQLSDEELKKEIEEGHLVNECLTELATLYEEIEGGQWVKYPYLRGEIIDIILEKETLQGKVLGYESSIRPNGELTDLIMIGFYKDKKMTKFEKVLAFPMEYFVEDISDVPIAPDTVVLAFGGNLNNKKVIEIGSGKK